MALGPHAVHRPLVRASRQSATCRLCRDVRPGSRLRPTRTFLFLLCSLLSRWSKNGTVYNAGPTCRPSTSTMRRVGLESLPGDRTKAERWAGMRRGTRPTRQEGHSPQSVTHAPFLVLSVWGVGPRPPVQGWWAAPLQRGATDGPLVHSSRTVFQDSSQKLTITLHFLHSNCLHRKEFHCEDAFT